MKHREPIYGEQMIFSGLFDMHLQRQIGVFVGLVKEKGYKKPLWKIKILETGEYITTTPCHMIRDFNTLDLPELQTIREHNVSLLESNPVESCCSKYSTRFCPECGSKL